MTENELTDPYAIAIKHLADATLKNDNMILDVVRALINRVLTLEARIEELELLNPRDHDGHTVTRQQ